MDTLPDTQPPSVAHQAQSDEDFVLRIGALKEVAGKLMSERWAYLWTDLLQRQFGNPVVADQEDMYALIDRFFNQYRFPDGRTPIQTYADETADLSPEERSTFRSWDQTIESVFEVTTVEDWRLELRDLQSDRRLVVRPNMHLPRNPFQSGMYLHARVVPVRAFFTFSGALKILKAADVQERLATLHQLPRWCSARPGSPRWVPSPDHPAPDPRAPCPCGSGRRYRKCCLRR